MAHQKRVVDEVSGWLRVYDDGSVDRTWTGPPEVKFMAEPVPPHQDFIDGVATRDVTINGNNLGGRVRIYLPQEKPEGINKLPIILHFHGGGFCISQTDWFMYYHIYSRLAKSVPAICISVYLRLAPENRLPAAHDDGYEALLWLRSLAQGEAHEPWLNEHADFERVFLIGDSSGGNLVHEVAARAGKMDISPVKLAGGIPVHPGFVRAERSKSELEQPESPFLTLEMVDKFLSLSLPLNCNKDHPFTCPMGPAAPPLADLNLPPFLLCVAENDLIKDTEMEYYEAMKKAGKDVELLINPGMGHSFYLNKIAVDMDPNTGAQTSGFIQGVAEFMRKH
ncbi:Alpha/beta-Hydrolases superfamily protein [Melia azedarach]|uniref:Alpha/beta-Hydrolases superfamily protein n=1 Tax=Melia azedarach TaxID=155640 RepID=A0ACC1YBA3_MELAZ|nr:Alpha/beta-Hydrolases superfamily protein [Melia azedarach]